MKENMSWCFFSEHSVYRWTSRWPLRQAALPDILDKYQKQSVFAGEMYFAICAELSADHFF